MKPKLSKESQLLCGSKLPFSIKGFPAAFIHQGELKYCTEDKSNFTEDNEDYTIDGVYPFQGQDYLLFRGSECLSPFVISINDLKNKSII